MPTEKPWVLRVAATLTATVLLPTPPLQLETAIIFLMPTKFPFLLNLSSLALGASTMSTSLKPAVYNSVLRTALILL